jgi:spore coat polysaccharide biosynthesis protein SpsF (cytidylyltransferase family)
MVKKVSQNKNFLIQTNINCGELVEVFKSDERTLVFIPIEYTMDAIEKANYFANKYAMDLWCDGKCDSFGIYFVDANETIDIPHVYVSLFYKEDFKVV